jgi:hypothetical protein
MTEIRIDSNVRIPIAKGVTLRKKAEQKAFKEYADAYERVYVKRPTLLGINKYGMFATDTLPQAVNARRMKELTRMLVERAKDL